MRRWLTVLVASALLAACAGIEQQEAKEKFASAKVQCKASIPRAIGNYEKRAECIAEAMESILEPAFPNDSDRVSEMASQTILIGQQIDQQKISPEQGNANLAEIGANLDSQADEERLERQQAAAANVAASAQLLNASAALAQASRPTVFTPQPSPFQYQAPVNTTCIRNGIMTTCTSQ